MSLRSYLASSHPRRKFLVLGLACLLLLGVSFIATTLQAQVADDGPLIYKQCYGNDKSFGQHQECGIDEQATQKLQRKIEAAKRPTTPEQEERIEQHLQQQFAGKNSGEQQDALLALLSRAKQRIDGLRAGNIYSFTQVERAFLQDLLTYIGKQETEAEEIRLSKKGIVQIKSELGGKLGQLQEILGQKQRQTGAAAPKIENLITRIDDLVAKVGTVIRNVERDGELVPAHVKRQHQKAIQLTAQAKRECSLGPVKLFVSRHQGT